MSNTDEYRASVLSALGIEDNVNIRYFADYRKALLMGLSMPASNEDLRNEENFRLKILEAVSNTNELIRDLLDGTEYTEKTASGNPAFFDDGAYGLPLKSLLVNISSKQSGSGDPSPQNIRPIEPWTDVKIYQSGEDRNNFLTKSFPLGRDVYGASLDVASGKLTLTNEFIDLGSLSWVNSGSYFTAETTLNYGSTSQWTVPNGLCDRFKIVSMYYVTNASARVDKSISWYPNLIRIADSSYTDETAFKNSLNGAQMVYELATPTEIQLTPTEVKTLLGANNIWSDAGEVVAKYLAK